MSAKDVLTTYAKLHQGKVGQHWLWAAIGRIVAGDDEAEVMRDFGFVRAHHLESLQSDLQGMLKCYWGLRELYAEKACELAKASEQRDDLLAAIQQTLDENSHLADGDDCTLIVLKRALEKVGAGGTAHNGEVRGASRPAGAASSAEGATSTVVLWAAINRERNG